MMDKAKNPKVNKSLVVIIVIAILAAGAGAGATFLLTKDKNQTVTDQKPTVFKDDTQRETTLPEGTLSPTEISSKFSEYNGKDLKVRGLITKTSGESYIIIGQEKDKPVAINVDFKTNNVDPSKFIQGYSNISDIPKNGSQDSKTQGAATVSGKLTTANQNITLIATKVEN